jgi:hypothetical protein
LSHGSITSAAINDDISTNGVIPTYTSQVLDLSRASATNRSMPKPWTGAIWKLSGAVALYASLTCGSDGCRSTIHW